MALSELSYNLSHQKIRQLIIEWELYDEKKCGIYFSIMTEWNGCSLDLSRIAHGLDNAAYWDWDEWTKKKIWAIFIAFANDRLMCAMNHLFYFVNCFYCCAQNVCTISVNISIYFLSLKRFFCCIKCRRSLFCSTNIINFRIYILDALQMFVEWQISLVELKMMEKNKVKNWKWL